MVEPCQAEEAVFLAALQKTTPDERAAYLEDACAGNPELQARVGALLRAHDEPDGPLETPPPRLAATIATSLIAERPGQTIGPYTLLEEIGEGGMGVVYLAEQQEPVRRKVALKIIKPGMDTRQVVARFGAERQALALMDHPNIAKVFDGGATDSGRPYFVMELVQGIPLTEYCDQNCLIVRQRLELFAKVCQAVQHAHSKGVIHRDLKPSHVPVTSYDGVPVPKIIDFGIAKATHGQLTERTLVTGFGLMIGTPFYMSPEQAEMGGQDVDTRSDVYSLGVMLYELLTGSTPFDQERLRRAGLDEIRCVIREEEPPLPSHRLSTLGAEAISTITAHRGVDARRLGRLLRGDLDWIVMKALEKDRSRRYESAAEFARDVQRYLTDEPVAARPPRLGDRVGKWVRRHRAAVWSAVALLLVSTIGSLASALLIAREQKRTAQAYQERTQ
jgi:serine/threonine protein kinase